MSASVAGRQPTPVSWRVAPPVDRSALLQSLDDLDVLDLRGLDLDLILAPVLQVRVGEEERVLGVERRDELVGDVLVELVRANKLGVDDGGAPLGRGIASRDKHVHREHHVDRGIAVGHGPAAAGCSRRPS